jgi:uncharacterized protein YcbX
MYLSEILTYPVKSCKGISLPKALIEMRGIALDRRWMLIDIQNRFISQRENPLLALIEVKIQDGFLQFDAPEMPALRIRQDEYSVLGTAVTIWGDICEAFQVSAEADSWFSSFLASPCRLVYMPESTERQVDTDYAPRGIFTGFSDAFPFLLITEGTLAELNSRLGVPVPMSRFRPNLVISGAEPFAEDTWRTIRIGEIIFEVAKPCARCVLTTIDQDTAEKGKEPLATLTAYRKQNNRVLFGQNLYTLQVGELKVGYKVEVLELK